MDIFMDKLAQRLTAQDIIQANTAADMEEMNKLKAQIAEYHQCLEQLKRLMDEESARLRGSRLSGENVDRLVEEGILKIRAIQADSRGTGDLQLKLSQQLNALETQLGNRLDTLQKQINDKLEVLERAGGRIDTLEQIGGKLDAIEQQIGEKLGAMEQQMGEKLGTVEQQVGEKFGTVEQQMGEKFGTVEQQMDEKLGAVERQMGEKLNAMEQQIGEKLGAVEQQMSDQLGGLNQQVGEQLNGLNRQVGATLEKLEQKAESPSDLDENKLTEKFATLEENVHKECVKVYRNVQAVVVEENGKQSDAMTETMSAVGKMKGKTGAILGISAAALLASLGSIILQLLQIMGIM